MASHVYVSLKVCSCFDSAELSMLVKLERVDTSRNKDALSILEGLMLCKNACVQCLNIAFSGYRLRPASEQASNRCATFIGSAEVLVRLPDSIVVQATV